MKRLTIIGSVIAFLLSCSTSLPYRESYENRYGLPTTGYKSKEVASGVYEIKVLAYSSTSEKEVMYIFHKRASELCGSQRYNVLRYEQQLLLITHVSRKYPGDDVAGEIKCRD